MGEFVRAFRHLGADAEAAFERFFGGRELTHAEFVAFTAGPGAGEPAGALPRGEVHGRV